MNLSKNIRTVTCNIFFLFFSLKLDYFNILIQETTEKKQTQNSKIFQFQKKKRIKKRGKNKTNCAKGNKIQRT